MEPAFEFALRGVGQVLDRIEVFTRDEVAGGEHRRPWSGEGQRRQGWSFCGEGFVTKRGNRFVKLPDRRKRGWRRAGGEEENYPNMRSPYVNHNKLNLRFLNLPVGVFVDDVNVFSLTTPVSDAEASVPSVYLV